ncbi:hypothetical protein ACF0H5_024528 [Mactra antiquata]
MWSGFHFRVDNERRLLDNDTVNQLLDTLKTLSCIRKVKLHHIDIPDNKYLLLHSDVTKVEIELKKVTMSDKCFLSFVQCCTSKKANVVVKHCTIIKHDGDNIRNLSKNDSCEYMYQHLTSIPNVIITEARWDNSKLKFETTNSHNLYTRHN